MKVLANDGISAVGKAALEKMVLKFLRLLLRKIN